MSVTLALAKGRAPHHRLLLTCRIVFALSVVADIRVHSRWIPSDEAPRRYQPLGLKGKFERGRALTGQTL
eukprot:7059417-Pyramimonas_sp.AAC.1